MSDFVKAWVDTFEGRKVRVLPLSQLDDWNAVMLTEAEVREWEEASQGARDAARDHAEMTQLADKA